MNTDSSFPTKKPRKFKIIDRSTPEHEIQEILTSGLPQPTTIRRVTLDIPKQAQLEIEKLERLTGDNLENILRNSLKLYSGLVCALESGDKIIIQDINGSEKSFMIEFE
jgi:hypothetical protein